MNTNPYFEYELKELKSIITQLFYLYSISTGEDRKYYDDEIDLVNEAIIYMTEG